MNTNAIVLLSLGLGALTIALVISTMQAKEPKKPVGSSREPLRESGLASRVPAATSRPLDCP